jgi:hypothetical protein
VERREGIKTVRGPSQAPLYLTVSHLPVAAHSPLSCVASVLYLKITYHIPGDIVSVTTRYRSRGSGSIPGAIRFSEK